MTLSTTDRPAGRHLAPVPDDAASAPATVADPTEGLLEAAEMAAEHAADLQRLMVEYLCSLPTAPPVLNRSGQLDFDQAELFLLSLDGELRADTPRTAYLLGLAEGHLANLIELVRALTSPVTEG